MDRARISNLLEKITLFFVICCLTLPAQGKYGGGTGEPNAPFLIYNANQMNAIGADPCDWDKCFKLMADIDLGVYTGTSFNVIGNNEKPFTGVFDGNQHTISNFNYTSTDRSCCIGLFGYIDTENAEIKYLGLIDANVNAQKESGAIGSLVGWLYKGKISNCYSTGIVSGDKLVGGLVGVNIGTLINCSSTGSVTGDDIVGGLVGDNTMSGTITNSYSSCDVLGLNYVAGLVGRNDGIIYCCYANGEVSGIYRVGGLSGANYNGRISNCYSEGNVSGFFSQVGGLVGHHWRGAIENCYSTRSVYGRGAGGLVGYKYEGRVTNSFWNIETSGQTSSDGGTGKTTAEMQMASTFIGWGCEPVWMIDEGKDYPRLAWENMPGDLLPQLSEFLTGSGTKADPYLIYTSEQLNLIGLFPCEWNKHFLLCADIDLSIYTGTSFNIIGYYLTSLENKPFTGVFDGNGHKISNFTYFSAEKHYIGLFGYVTGEIEDLGLICPNIDVGTGYYVGSLVGFLVNGTIINCYAEYGSVSGDYRIGGLVGYNSGTINNCYSTGSVSGNYGIGGLVGGNYRGTNTNCYSAGSVTGRLYIGGLVGFNSYGTITNCYSSSDVSGTHEDAGGLVGRSRYSTISHCYATGSVSGDEYVGGLVGCNDWDNTTTNCYSKGSVSGNRYVGGLVGQNGRCRWGYCFPGTISNCYSTGSVTGNNDVGGLVGYNEMGEIIDSFWDIETSMQSTSAGGRGLSTAQMQMASTFINAGWDFEDVWWILEGTGYPRLWWECKYGGGSGHPNDPYLIYTAEQMNTIGACQRDLDKHFLLCADIDLSAFTGTSFNIIGYFVNWGDNKPFTGSFDGSSHTISNFTYNSTGKWHIGIFGYVSGENAEVKNLGLIDPDVDAGTGYDVGSLVGWFDNGTITNCYVEGGSVSGDQYVGGLVGLNMVGTIIKCYSKGSVTGDEKVGGLVGGNSYGTITNCHATAGVSGDWNVGGLVGENFGIITNCYSSGSVSGKRYVGGLVGGNWFVDSKISNCYSTGSVVGEWNVGGLMGYNEGTVLASFWDIETSGQTISAGGTGKTTEEMQTMSTFTDAGWDFVGETVNGIEDLWFIPQGDYPHLWWEGMQVPMKLTPGTLNCRSEGNWVKAHITLPEGFTVADVDPDRPAVLHSFGFQSLPPYVFVNKDNLVEIEAAFEREQVCSLVGDWPEDLTVAVFLADGNIFLGTSTVRIIHPGVKAIEDLAIYWLNADCVHPDFCNGIDMNKDSLVNLPDYALLINTNVEFVTDE